MSEDYDPNNTIARQLDDYKRKLEQVEFEKSQVHGLHDGCCAAGMYHPHNQGAFEASQAQVVDKRPACMDVLNQCHEHASQMEAITDQLLGASDGCIKESDGAGGVLDGLLTSALQLEQRLEELHSRLTYIAETVGGGG